MCGGAVGALVGAGVGAGVGEGVGTVVRVVTTVVAFVVVMVVVGRLVVVIVAVEVVGALVVVVIETPPLFEVLGVVLEGDVLADGELITMITTSNTAISALMSLFKKRLSHVCHGAIGKSNSAARTPNKAVKRGRLAREKMIQKTVAIPFITALTMERVL